MPHTGRSNALHEQVSAVQVTWVCSKFEHFCQHATIAAADLEDSLIL